MFSVVDPKVGEMRYREFWQLVDEVLGEAQGRELVRTFVVGDLDGRTAQRALDDGEEPRTVWHALCDALGIPDAERWGHDRHRQAPPRR
jgi:hypothetical protein